MLKLNQLLTGVVFSVVLTHLTLPAALAEDFDQEHPRRAEVIHREQNELKENNSAAANGSITQKQANQLDREDQHIRNQERADAKKHGGHITKAEQRRLNREENRVNRQRASMERRDARKKNKK